MKENVKTNTCLQILKNIYIYICFHFRKRNPGKNDYVWNSFVIKSTTLDAHPFSPLRKQGRVQNSIFVYNSASLLRRNQIKNLPTYCILTITSEVSFRTMTEIAESFWLDFRRLFFYGYHLSINRIVVTSRQIRHRSAYNLLAFPQCRKH